MFTIRKATVADCELIHKMAKEVFPATYKEILSPEQLDYMMDWMYSLPNLYRQITEQHHTYLILSVNHEPAGYSSVQPEGQRLVRELAAQCDVVLENFKVGGLAAYGLDYASLKAVNPRLIYCSITGFGQDGPYARRAGYDFMIQGLGGLMSLTGRPEG